MEGTISEARIMKTMSALFIGIWIGMAVCTFWISHETLSLNTVTTYEKKGDRLPLGD